jgi:hypothetical protein
MSPTMMAAGIAASAAFTKKKTSRMNGTSTSIRVTLPSGPFGMNFPFFDNHFAQTSLLRTHTRAHPCPSTAS